MLATCAFCRSWLVAVCTFAGICASGSPKPGSGAFATITTSCSATGGGAAVEPSPSAAVAQTVAPAAKATDAAKPPALVHRIDCPHRMRRPARSRQYRRTGAGNFSRFVRCNPSACATVSDAAQLGRARLARLLVRLQAVDIELARSAGGAVYAPGVVAARADIDPAVGDGRHGELDGVAGSIAPRERTVPELAQGHGIICAQHCWAATLRARRAIAPIVENPDDAVRFTERRDRRRGARIPEGARLRGGPRKTEMSGGRIEPVDFQRLARAGHVIAVVPERSLAENEPRIGTGHVLLDTGPELLQRLGVAIATQASAVDDKHVAVLAGHDRDGDGCASFRRVRQHGAARAKIVVLHVVEMLV